MLFTYPLMAAIQEISARIGRVTGKGIAGNLRAALSAVAAARASSALLLIANTINLGADLGAMGDGAEAAGRRAGSWSMSSAVRASLHGPAGDLLELPRYVRS